jgi:hypothetical protein
MKLRSIAAFGVTALVGQAALAQPAPPAPPPPASTGAPAPPPFSPAPPPVTARPRPAQPPPAQPPPPSGWGSGIAQPAPPAQPAPAPPMPGQAAQPAPAQPPPAPPPAPAPPPQPYPQGGYPPPGGYPQGGYPQGGYPPPSGYPQGGYPGWGSEDAPTVMGADGRPRLLPLEMKYDPDKGLPPGYRVVEQRRTTIAIAGASIFGGLWIASAIAGGVMEDGGRYNGREGWPMYIPVLGPFITIGTYDVSAGGATPMVFVGLGQAIGVAMFIFGMATTEKIAKYQFETAGVKWTPLAGPIENGGLAGLTGTF